jgi:hypothetical protein
MASRTERDTGSPFPPDVIAWRRERLRLAGFESVLAAMLARGTCDLHALLDLVERGCSPDLAARIVAPLEQEGPP